MQDQPELVGERALTGGAVRGELALVQLDQVLGLAAGAVDSFVEMAGLAAERGDDVAGVEAARGRLQPGDDTAFALPGSGGTELTAHDAVFSARFCMHEDAVCVPESDYDEVEAIEALDDYTVQFRFNIIQPYPYGFLVGSGSPILQMAQFQDCMGAAAAQCADQNFGPIGTGPFKVDGFVVNESVSYSANENYRDPDKPAFATVTLTGGGDAVSAARSVLETGEADYAWNVQVAPEVLERMSAAGAGVVVAGYAANVERLIINQTNSDPALGADRRSLYLDGDNPHPFLSDLAVRRALSLAIDGQSLVDAGYGIAGQVTCNILPAPEKFVSTANEECRTQNLDEANRILDEAGWIPGEDGVRAKDGLRISILYQTTTNSVRQGTQALIQGMWEQIGVETILRDIEAAAFFDSDPESPDTCLKFYADVQMYTNGVGRTDPEGYLSGWTCDTMPTPENQWLGSNSRALASPSTTSCWNSWRQPPPPRGGRKSRS